MSIVLLVFLAAALLWIECMIGGTRLLFAIPAYTLISLAAILSLAGLRGRKIPPDAFCIGSALLLGGWVLFRSSHSPVPYLAWPDFLMMLACLMVYFLSAFCFNGTPERIILICVLVAIAAAEVWFGLIQFAQDSSFMPFGFIRPAAIQRASGMFISPNSFAGYLFAIGIVCLSFGVWSRQRIPVKILAVYVAAFCWVGVAVSGSRGGYFATVGSLLCFVLTSLYTVRKTNGRAFAVAVIGSLAVLAIFVAGATALMMHSDFLTGRLQTMVSRDVRIYNWEAALDHFRVSPWGGTGAGTHLIYGRLFRRPELQADPVHAHCDYLELLAEYGVAGGVCMALFLAAHIRSGARSLSAMLQRPRAGGYFQSDRLAILFGGICAVAGLAVHSIVDFDMHIPGDALVFAFLFGTLANPGVERPLNFLDLRVTGWARLILPILGVWMLWKAVPLLPSEYCSEMARRSIRTKAFLDGIDYAKKGLGQIPAGGSPGSTPEARCLDYLLRILGPNPANPVLYFYLGETNRALAMRMIDPVLRRQFYAEAETAFEHGLKIFPQDENMLVRSGQVLDGLKRYQEAEINYQKALALDPNLGLIYSYYASHLEAEGKKAEAEAFLRSRKVGAEPPPMSDLPALITK